jgi:4-oxalomesaconate tautomerase
MKPEVLSAALLRTARWLFDGVVGIPSSVFNGRSSQTV